jgi:hypothetical protein
MTRILSAVLLLACLLPSPGAWAGVSDPAALRREIEASRLDPARAVTLKNLKLNAGIATLTLGDGVLLPVSAVGGKTVEMVFLGQGRIVIEPPDAVEAGQLDLFTGAPRLDEELTEMVLVLGLDAAVDAILKRPRAEPLDATLAQRAEEVYAKWKGSPERKLLNVDGAVLKDVAGDSSSQGFFAAWFKGTELGEFLYLVEPDSQEQVTLGHFVPLEATEKEKRKILRQLGREQRRGRLIGVELDDLGQWDTWLSASLKGKDGSAAPGRASFEPQKYTLEVSIAEKDLRLSGRARLDLKPAVRGSRAVDLRLNGDLAVSQVTDGSGAKLFFHRQGTDLTVLLPQAPADEETVSLNVEYSGSLVEKQSGRFALLDTLEWYPHAGTVDRAPYDVTFRWPRRLDLVSCGRRAEGGEGRDGLRWERRVLDIPTAGFAFEIGKYRIETTRAGHVDIRLAFDPDVSGMGKDARQEIAKTVGDSLVYFEELFGPYPLDELTVVTVPRDFSQAMLGFVTLSSLMMTDLGVWNLFLGLEDRRTVIAHEVAHQWWGHMVGWESYRDQWISEAMANYASLLYGRNKLDKKNRFGLGPTEGWQESLTSTTEDGRAIESLGPVVLGTRLFSSRSGNAYQAIVYNKGAVILDMLSKSLGEENFPKILRQVVKVSSNRAISTEDFLAIIEKVTTADLDPFANQFVYGTGLPEVYYSYRFEPAGDGKWKVAGEARQQAPYRFRYKAVKTGNGFDVARERLDQIEVAGSTLVVPVEIEIHDPSQEKVKGKKGETAANGRVRGRIVLQGETTDIAIDLDHEPKSFWLDRHEEVFGRFFNESRTPKRVLFYQGLDAAAAGKAGEAEALFGKALAAEVFVSSEKTEKRSLKQEAKVLDAQIDLSRARLFLDQSQDAEAQAALDRAHRVLGTYGGWVEEDLKILQSRLEMRRGVYDKAFKRLRKGLLKSGSLDSTEGYVLLAIAAQATGHKEELEEAMKQARENGADLTSLASR